MCAFGISGVEGVFRTSCEITLNVLRNNTATLKSVLHTFIHDPLVDFRAHRREATSPEGLKMKGKEIMQKIDRRLQGLTKDTLILSVHGQVHQLIKAAASESNLSRMYIGWMPWL